MSEFCESCTTGILSFDSAINSLTNEKPFAEFDYELLPEEQNIIDSIHINHSFFAPENIGSISSNKPDEQILEIADFLNKVGNSKDIAIKASNIIHNVITNLFQNYHYYLQYVGLSAIEAKYEIAWHTDPGTDNYRVSLVFKGRPTLFCNSPKLTALDQSFCTQEDVYQSQAKSSVFLNNEALHSSPPLDQERLVLFISLKNNDKKFLNAP